jgi:4-aminobutyrate--pyruvate transaminase
MAPPLIITQSEIEELGRRLWSALDRVLADPSPGARAAIGSTPQGPPADTR